MFARDIVIGIVFVFFSASHIRCIVGCRHIGIIHHIGIGICYVCSLRPIRLNGNACYALWHIPIGSLIEYATTYAIQILIGTITIGKVKAWCISSTGAEGTWRTTRDADNLPSSYHTITGIVARSYIVIVRQLHLVVVEVKMVWIFICDVEREVGFGNGGSCRSTENFTTA